MKNTINKIAFAGASLALLVPAFVGAQFAAPSGTGLPSSGILAIVTNIMNWLLIAVGIIGVIGFAIAGLLYLTAAGDDGRIDKAKGAMVASITGIIVALAGLVAINLAVGILGAQSRF